MLNSTGTQVEKGKSVVDQPMFSCRKYDIEKEYQRMKQAGIFTAARPE